MTNIVQEAIVIEDGNFVFNAEGTGPTVHLTRKGDAGRVAKGLRLFLAGKVDVAAKAVVAEGDPSIRYIWDVERQQMVEQLLRPGLKGMNWQNTGQIDPGYSDTDGDRTFTHQVSSHHAAILFALNHQVITVPVTDGNTNAVNKQIGYGVMTPEQIAADRANYRESDRILVRL